MENIVCSPFNVFDTLSSFVLRMYYCLHCNYTSVQKGNAKNHSRNKHDGLGHILKILLPQLTYLTHRRSDVGEKTGRIVRNGVVINNHIHRVGPISTVAAPVAVPAPNPAVAPVEAPAPALVQGKPLPAIFVLHINMFIENEEWLTAMLTGLTRHNVNNGDHVEFLHRD